ncbi:hypothetical protein [Limimaricola pyoseonensis]|uniref:Microcystin-dependent protein n=1 Tax=Limimaricola pyoseonensis TaxID=521013 RepID=A0A1G7GD26_9RHOB|nr:hypothetical protein [Limimaricola pyoseonensis]SDE86034.1 hypothetical protein SAMN04488567_2845 [Limimaricola pyoseonensis]
MSISAQRTPFIGQQTTVKALALLATSFAFVGGAGAQPSTGLDDAVRLLIDKVESIDSDIEKLQTEVELLQNSKIARGAVVYFRDTECPNDSWRPYDNARGRYIVSLTENGVLGATIGEPLTDKEQRRVVGRHDHGLSTADNHVHGVSTTGIHSHEYRSTDNGPLHDNGSNFIGGAGRFGQVGTKTSGGDGNHQHNIAAAGAHGHSVAAAGKDIGTSAPYIQLLACEKIR